MVGGGALRGATIYKMAKISRASDLRYALEAAAASVIRQ